MRADIHDGQGARNAPCNGPNTDARDQLSPDHYIRLAPHGRSIHKYMAKRGGPSGQTWDTFLRNHAPHIAAMDLFVVPHQLCPVVRSVDRTTGSAGAGLD